MLKKLPIGIQTFSSLIEKGCLYVDKTEHVLLFIAKNKTYQNYWFETGTPAFLLTLIRRLFASIAYHNFTKSELARYEGFYASVLYAYFASLGVELIAEDVSNRGRVDLTIKKGRRVYLFEFKVNDETALAQIKDRRYHEKYTGEIFMIGIVFDSEKRNIKRFDWERC